MMQAAFYETTGPAHEVLKHGLMEIPRPAAGEVLVRVMASGINPADVKRRAGWRGMQMEHPRVIPHTDGAGAIVDVGEGVDRARIDERVWLWNAQGGYGEAGRAFGTAAEFIAIDAQQAVPLPDALSFEEGACLGVPAMTAYRALFSDGPIDGCTVFISGAAGAVGHFAVQMAVAAGATVFGSVSSEASASHAKSAGAHHLINRKRDDVAKWVLDLTGGQGVDRVIEVDFGDNLALDAAILKANGTVASYSSSSDPTPVLPYYAFAAKGANLRFIQGFRIPEAARLVGHRMIATLAANQRLAVAIGARFPLSEIAKAHQRVEAGGLGNVVVQLSPAPDPII
ncbi:NADPH:quinone reductase [Rhizobium sp. RU36D]|uniref:NADPH:quinone reductase n=1 Tax=Rhizobium sp. RU36D TaxID=1907415 RepID=UPI0009D83672|nr:NADPH:quinone reductase [Rhizobium sp. RU36D]SMC71375.1 NADPH:quinone reductase [Rhizobium sp. RU36D]